MPAKTYRIKLSRDGHEFEAEGDKAFVEQMLKRYSPMVGGSVSAVAAGKAESKSRVKKDLLGVAPVNTKSLSIREFIQRFGFTKHTDITLAFGYFLERYSGVSEFTPADINNCYYEAKLESSNTSQMIIQNIKRGYVMPSKKKGQKGRNLYTLTSTGEGYISSKLSGTS